MTTSQPERIACPLCGAAQPREPFFVLRNVPVTCTSIFDTAATARAVPSGGVELSVCASCGFIFSGTFDPALGELGARYESSQAASLHFSAFMQSLAGEWTDRYRLSGKTVLEVGCGSGHFLRALLERGVGSAIGMDPFAETAGEGATNPNLQLIADRFDARSLHRHADALVCRHTLEHIQDVSGFLQLLRRWAGDNSERVLLFEVPDAERVLTERAFWDVYYEHCNYFTASTLRFAFESAGFEVLRLARVYGDQYLIVEAAASTHGARPAPSSPAVSQARASCRSFGEDVRSSIDRCARTAARMARESPPLILWQGAAKTVGFLAALADPAIVAAAIDLSPARQGRFLPGTGLPVYAPERLLELHPGNVVLMNPVYLAEVVAHVRSLGLDVPVHSVNDLLTA